MGPKQVDLKMDDPQSITVDCVRRLASGRESVNCLQLCDGERVIEVVVNRRRRKTLDLQVRRDGVELKVPINLSWSEINNFLSKHFDWIFEGLVELSSRPVNDADSYVRGGEISFLGERYALELVKSQTAVITLDGSALYVSCRNPDIPSQVERGVMRWYRRQAEEIFEEQLQRINKLFADDLRPSGLTVRKMRSRWGSCSVSGQICLNLLLVRQKLPLIDFVVAHELCHLRHFSHNKDFFRLLSKVMPDWRDREKQLRD